MATQAAGLYAAKAINWVKTNNPITAKHISDLQDLALSIIRSIGELVCSFGSQIKNFAGNSWTELSKAAATLPPEVRAGLLVVAFVAAVVGIVHVIRSLVSAQNAAPAPAPAAAPVPVVALPAV